MTTQELLKLSVLICVLLHRRVLAGWAAVVATTGPPVPWDPSRDTPTKRWQMELCRVLAGSWLWTCTEQFSSNSPTAKWQGRRLSKTPGCIIDISNNPLRPLQKGGKKFFQLQVGVSTRLPWSFPSPTFSLLQMSWLQHSSGLQCRKCHQTPEIPFYNSFCRH